MQYAVDRITVKGFRSIRSLENFSLRPLNVLIGGNGAGKSNFVSLFALLRSIVKQEMNLAIEKGGGADVQLFLGPRVTKEIAVALVFGKNTYEFTLQPTPRNTLVFGSEQVSFDGDLGSGRDDLGRGHTESKLKDFKDSPKRIAFHVHQAMTRWTVYHFHDTSETSGVRRQWTTRDRDELLRDASNLAAFLLFLQDLLPDDYSVIRDTVRLVAPFFEDFKLRPEVKGADTLVQLEWTQRGSDYPFHPSQLSDGTLRFICLATALLQPNPPATMLFDEPELGLHPFALSVLADLIKQAASRSQIIVSTQSAPLLDHFEADVVVVVDREEGASTFRRLGSDELSEWLENYTLGELWQKNVFQGGPVHE